MKSLDSYGSLDPEVVWVNGGNQGSVDIAIFIHLTEWTKSISRADGNRS